MPPMYEYHYDRLTALGFLRDTIKHALRLLTRPKPTLIVQLDDTQV